MGAQSCGRGWRETPLPGITTTVMGERGETGRGSGQLGRARKWQAVRQAVVGPPSLPWRWGLASMHTDSLISTDGRWGGVGVHSLPGPDPGSEAH